MRSINGTAVLQKVMAMAKAKNAKTLEETYYKCRDCYDSGIVMVQIKKVVTVQDKKLDYMYDVACKCICLTGKARREAFPSIDSYLVSR